MKKTAALAVLAVLALAVATSAAARDPRDEKLHLTKPDMALAARLALHRAMLASGWTATKASPFGDDSSRKQCAGMNFDLSAFTITGHREAAFARSGGQQVESDVEVYASRAQARGDYVVGFRHLKAATACLVKGLQIGARQGGATVSGVRTRRSTVSSLGERSFTVSVAAKMAGGGNSVPLYFDLVDFQRGRAQVAVTFWSLGRPLGGRLALARLLDRRVPR
jgi:hypothetical protein